MKKATSGFSCSTSGYSSQSVSCETAAAAADYPQCSRNEYLTPSSYMSTIPTTPMNANSNKITMRTSTPTAPINNSHKFASGSISTISSFSQPLSPPQFFYSTSSVNIAASEKPTEKRQRGASYSPSSSSSSSSSYIVQFFWFIFSCFNLSWLFKRDATSRKNSATESIIVSEPISTNLPNKSLPMVVSQICSSTPISSTTLTNNTFYYDQSETYDNIPFNGNTKMIQSSYTSLNQAAIPTYIDQTSNYSHGSEYCSHQSLINQPAAVFQPQVPITRPVIQTQQQQQQHQPIILSSKSLEKIYENISAASLSLPPNPPPPPTNLQICQHNSTSSSFKCIQNNRNSNIHSTPDDSVLSSSRLSSLSSSPSSSATSSSASLGTNTVNSNNRHSFQVQQQQHVANDFRIQQISPSQDSISLIPAKLPYFAASTMGMQTPQETTTTTTIVKPYYLSMINLSHHDYYTYQNQPIEHHSMNRNQQYYTSTFKSTSQQQQQQHQQRMYYPSSYQLKQRRNELCKDLFNPVIPHYDDYLCDKEVESYFGDSVYDLCYPSNNISASYNSLQIEQTPQPQLVKQSSHTPYKLKSSPVSFDAGSTLSYDLSTNSSSTNSCAAKVSFSAYQKIFQNSSNLIAISQHSESYC